MNWWMRSTVAAAGVTLFLVSVQTFRRSPDPVFEGQPTSYWTRQLLSPEYRERIEAESTLIACGELALPQLRLLVRKQNSAWIPFARKAAEHFSFLNLEFYDPDLARARAADVAAALGPKAAALSPDLVWALQFHAGQESVQRAIRRIGQQAEEHLRDGLAAKNPRIRTQAASLLADLSFLEPVSVSKLVLLLQDQDPHVRLQAAVALGRNGSGPHVEQALLQMVEDDSVAEIRAKAAEALGRMPASSNAMSILSRVMRSDQEETVRFEAAKAAWRISRNESLVLPVLIELLNGNESWRVAYLLAEIGPAAAPATAGLIEAMKREIVPRALRTAPSSSFALGQIGPEALPQLAPLLEDANPRLRLFAVMAVGFMGQKAGERARIILPLLEDRHAEIRHAAAMALGQAGMRDEQVITGLASCLSAEDVYLRSAAADMLAKLAPEKHWVVLPE